MAARKHFYLVVDAPDEDRIGGVDITDTRRMVSEKNKQTTQQFRNLETGDTYTEDAVSLGYHDFDDEEDYEERVGEVVTEKLGEVDERHLEDAGLDPKEVIGE